MQNELLKIRYLEDVQEALKDLRKSFARLAELWANDHKFDINLNDDPNFDINLNGYLFEPSFDKLYAEVAKWVENSIARLTDEA